MLPREGIGEYCWQERVSLGILQDRVSLGILQESVSLGIWQERVMSTG